MSISIASAPTSVISEPSRSEVLFPSYVRDGGFEIVRLIKSYYDYLNEEGMPSHEINNMIANHDIDVVSDKYLSAIQLEVAKSVPESTVLDKRRLYKIVSQYYKTRGSEQSVNGFFRIFFDEMVSVFYPSSQLFNTSGDKSQSSSQFVIQDGDYWQKYSYEIKTKHDATAWKNPFIKFVHPAGLKLFITILAIMYVDNTWEGPLEDYIDSLQSITAEEYWKNINLDMLIGRHSPKFQPGTSYTLDYLFKAIIDSEYHYRTQTYPINGVAASNLYASLLSVFIDLLLIIDANISVFRSDYQEWLKFYDAASISSYADKTIADASADYDPVNACRFESLGTDAIVYKNNEESYGDVVDIGSQTNWTSSYFTSGDDSVPDIPVYIPGYAPELLESVI
jgi:hypothetical protein